MSASNRFSGLSVLGLFAAAAGLGISAREVPNIEPSHSPKFREPYQPARYRRLRRPHGRFPTQQPTGYYAQTVPEEHLHAAARARRALANSRVLAPLNAAAVEAGTQAPVYHAHQITA